MSERPLQLLTRLARPETDLTIEQVHRCLNLPPKPPKPDQRPFPFGDEGRAVSSPRVPGAHRQRKASALSSRYARVLPWAERVECLTESVLSRRTRRRRQARPGRSSSC